MSALVGSHADKGRQAHSQGSATPGTYMAATKTRKTKALSIEEMAAALVYETKHGAEAAARQFQTSARTIARRKAEIRKGKHAELARLVAVMQREAVARNQDLLTDTLATVLRQIGEKAPTASFADLVKAAKDLGEIKVTVLELGHELTGKGATTPNGATKEGVTGSKDTRPEAGGGPARPEPPRVH